jgi:hypothetical protein
MFAQEAKLDHRIQPETESMVKMILETPFVVRSTVLYRPPGRIFFPNSPKLRSLLAEPQAPPEQSSGKTFPRVTLH